MTDSPADISHVIQLSIAPVFLLMALGTFINVLASRLARIIDRTRALEARGPEASQAELNVLRRRRWLVNVAITGGTFSALVVCLSIVCAFVGSLMGASVAHLIAGLFITAMLGFVSLLLGFLAEVRLALLATPGAWSG